MSEFKVGDKVVRNGGDYMNVKRGEHYTVSKIHADDSLSLYEVNGCYDDIFFELVKEEEMTQQFKNMKFDVAAIAKELGVKHEEASRIIQEALFELGYKWRDGSVSIRNDVEWFIVCCEKGFIHPNKWIWVNCLLPFDFSKIKQTFSIVPVEQEEFVELNGKKYNKKELEAALSMLKPVEEQH